jgi:proline dehydrogenase
VAYGQKSTAELVLSLVIFHTCQFQPLVRNAQSVLDLCCKVFGQKLTMGIVKRTFFAHFCAGENSVDIRPKIAALRSAGVGGILDYAAEADLEEDGDKKDGEGEMEIVATTPPGIQCRTYDYQGEKACDANRDIFLDCVNAVHKASPEGFAAIKITALGNPLLLERMSTCLVEIKKFFYELAELSEEAHPQLTLAQFSKGYRRYFRDADDATVQRWFDRFDEDGDGLVDPLEWTNKLGLEDVTELVSHCQEEGPLSRAALTESELKLFRDMTKRIHDVAECASEMGVRLLIDAEQTYFQPAIDNFVLVLQREYNKDRPVIFNTVQCYLKDAMPRTQVMMTRSEKEGFYFAAKLVRGAYMVAERERAQAMGYASPICDTIADTHANYNAILNFVLGEMQHSNVMVASHNQHSVEFAIKRMHELNLKPEDGGVYFAQLLGMSDHLTFSLGAHGYKAYKYVPFGAVHEVMPYLLRRAQENSDIMGGVGQECAMLRREIKRRLLG